MKASPEHYLATHQRLLDCLTQARPATVVSRLKSFSEADWAEIVAMSLRHGVVPLLYDRLAHGEAAAAVPEAVVQTLREAYLMNGARNAFLYNELGQVLTALHRKNIPVIVLKGGHLSASFYKNPALRMMNDIDVLVRRMDLEQTVSTLRDLGYSAQTDGTGFREQHHHLPRMFKVPSLGIEVHWAMALPTLPFNIDTNGLWQRARHVEIAGAPAQTLSVEDLLLHVCVHSASHQSEALNISHSPFCLGLKPLFDLEAILQTSNSTIDWPQLQSRAKDWRVTKCVFLSLWLAKELLRAAVTEAVLTSLKPTDFDQRWTALACEQVALAGAERMTPAAVTSVLVPFMKSSEQHLSHTDRARTGWLRLLFRTAFPPRAAMAEYMAKHHSLPLNPIRNYTCYITRALDWLPKACRLAWYCLRHQRQARFYARQSQQPLLWHWLIDGENSAESARTPRRDVPNQ